MLTEGLMYVERFFLHDIMILRELGYVHAYDMLVFDNLGKYRLSHCSRF